MLVVVTAVFSSTACGSGRKFFAYRSFWPETAAMKQFADAGINIYAVMPSNTFNTLGEPYCKFPPFWVWDETYLWNIVDEQFDLVLKQNPDARFICMIDLNSPLWLVRRLSRKYGMGGDSFQEISNSLCIKEWCELTEKMVAAYARHMEKAIWRQDIRLHDCRRWNIRMVLLRAGARCCSERGDVGGLA